MYFYTAESKSFLIGAKYYSDMRPPSLKPLNGILIIPDCNMCDGIDNYLNSLYLAEEALKGKMVFEQTYYPQEVFSLINKRKKILRDTSFTENGVAQFRVKKKHIQKLSEILNQNFNFQPINQ